jgi:hypothetical protein
MNASPYTATLAVSHGMFIGGVVRTHGMRPSGSLILRSVCHSHLLADKEIDVSSPSPSLATPSKQFPSHIHMVAGSPRVMVQVEPIDIGRHNDAADKQEAAMIDSFTRSAL